MGEEMTTDYEPLKDTVESGVFAPWQEVDVEIVAFSELGITVTINDEYTGLVYGDQVYGRYQRGQRLKAYIKCVRDDGKIDVVFQPQQVTHVRSASERVLAHLEETGGSSWFNDKSSPESIRREFQVSKKVFKQAVGRLYRDGKIKISADGMELVEK
jgi:predicted RNA-binding protein (virulence factor B family)